MTEQGRQESGKFAAKSEEIRQVRAIRLTDTAWNKLGEWAESQGLSRADFLEDLVTIDVLQLKNEILTLKKETSRTGHILQEDSIHLSEEVLKKVDVIASLSRITRTELIEKLIISDSFKQKTKALDGTGVKGNQLAKRLGVDPKTLRDYRDGKRSINLTEWSKTKTIDGKGWDYSPETGLYFQVE